jgi:glutaconate CoA-transferase, subunit B
VEAGTYAIEELMMTEIARQVRDGERVAVGTLSPLPAAGVLLALMTTAPKAEAFIWLMPDYWPFTEGMKEFFDIAARGDVNLFFLGGAQIDGKANTNLNCIGLWEQPKVRLPGGAGTGTLYNTVERVVLFSERHNPRSFVENVDFITGCGSPPSSVFRRGGPTDCITPLAVMSFDALKKGWNLSSLHPGVSLETVRDNTGFSFLKEAQELTPPPTQEQLTLLRGPVKDKLAMAYPRFVKKLWG